MKFFTNRNGVDKVMELILEFAIGVGCLALVLIHVIIFGVVTYVIISILIQIYEKLSNYLRKIKEEVD